MNMMNMKYLHLYFMHEVSLKKLFAFIFLLQFDIAVHITTTKAHHLNWYFAIRMKPVYYFNKLEILSYLEPVGLRTLFHQHNSKTAKKSKFIYFVVMSLPSNIFKPLTVIVITILVSLCASYEDKAPIVISNCFIRDYNHVRCTGDFNVSNFLFDQRQQVDPNVSAWLQPSYTGLEIFNSNIEEIDENITQLHGFKLETILIENAPKLRSITRKALIELKDDLKDFRAINTALPQYNNFGNDENENPFDDFKQLAEVYIGEQSRCPSDETILFPCTCKFGELSRKVPSGLYGWSSGTANIFGTTTHVTCNKKDLTGDQLKNVFENISRSNHQPKHFDVLTISRTMSLTHIPNNVFSNISITTIWMEDVYNLKSINSRAFVSATSDRISRSIQILDISNANFTTASSTEVDDLFRAFSSLTNIRFLRLSECGIPHIPPRAFAVENPENQLNNLRYLTFSFDRRRHRSGIKSVGSYAFSGAPKLVELGMQKNFIEQFESFAFAFNETSDNRLTIHIGGNPFNDSYGLKPNAFSGSQRPLRITFNVNSFEASDAANDPSLDFIPENVFRPFIEENSENYFEVDYFNVDVWCDCKSKWMFDDIGNLKQNVQKGLRIKRIVDDIIGNDPLSIQCKAESSFECLPNCLSFASAGLIHCGGSNPFDVKSTFRQLGESSGTEAFNKLLFSSKEIQELPVDAFGTFQFGSIALKGI